MSFRTSFSDLFCWPASCDRCFCIGEERDGILVLFGGTAAFSVFEIERKAAARASVTRHFERAVRLLCDIIHLNARALDLLRLLRLQQQRMSA
jgi:hypothetical protein